MAPTIPATGGVPAPESVRRRACTDREREIGPGPFEDGAERVGGPAESARQRVGEVDGDEHVIGVVHRAQQRLGRVKVARPEQVEGVAAQFGRASANPFSQAAGATPKSAGPGTTPPLINTRA